MIPVPKVDDVDVAFPANALTIMPAWEDIPDKFRKHRPNFGFGRLFFHLFFKGIKNVRVAARKGINEEEAWRALSVIAGSFASNHEHKEAAFVYLAHEWFDEVRWECEGEEHSAVAERDGE